MEKPLSPDEIRKSRIWTRRKLLQFQVILRREQLMSAADNLGNLFVALLAGIPLLIFVLFACCACLEASISAARRSYKPHLPTRVRFADEAAGEESNNENEQEEDHGGGSSNDNRRQSRNPLLFGVNSSSRSTNRSGTGRLEGSGLMAHSSYIQRFPNYRYSTVAQSSGRTTPPPVLKSRTELGSGSIKSPLISPLLESQKLLDKEHHHRSTPTRTPPVGSPAYPKPTTLPTPAPGRAVRQDISIAADTQKSQQISEKTSPTHLSSVLNYFDGSRRSSTSTPTTSPTFQIRPKSPFDGCGPHVDPQGRYSTPSSPTMYAYTERPQGPSNYSSMSYLPEVKTYLHFMEEDFSNRQRSHSFSGRSTRRSPCKTVQRVPATPDSFNLESTMMSDNASKISTPSSFGNSIFLTPPGSTDQGSFKSPESGTPEWLLSSDVPPPRIIQLIDDTSGEGDLIFKQLSRSGSIRTAFL